MSNSNLVNVTIKSPNHSGQRTHSIDRITPHCVVGQLSAEGIGSCFPKGRNASCNYGIGKDGRVVLVVDECNRSWCSSSSANDQRAITIECASDKTAPYAFNSIVYNKLIDLCVDICKRNGKTKLLWINDKNKALSYNTKSNEMILTVHKWFANKSCPGDWLMSRMSDLATKVTQRLNKSTNTNTNVSRETSNVDIDDLVNATIRGEFGNGQDRKNALGSNFNEVQKRVNAILNGSQNATVAKVENVYTVKSGDSLWSIAERVYRNGSKYTLLKEKNGLISNTIYPGQQIKY